MGSGACAVAPTIAPTDRKKSLAALPLFKKAGEALGAQIWHVDDDFNPVAPRPAKANKDQAPDSEADTDANFVMTGTGNIVEIQGTAEKTPFSEEQLLALLALARKGVGKLVDLQKMAVT